MWVVIVVVVVMVGVDVGPAAAHNADEAPRRGTHFQHYLGLCWATLTHREQQERKKHVKNRGFSGWSATHSASQKQAAPLEGHGPDGAHRLWPDWSLGEFNLGSRGAVS